MLKSCIIATITFRLHHSELKRMWEEVFAVDCCLPLGYNIANFS